MLTPCRFPLPGYTVSSVISTEHERIYVAGAPRFNHTGKVIIFSMHNNRNLTIHQALKGEQVTQGYALPRMLQGFFPLAHVLLRKSSPSIWQIVPFQWLSSVMRPWAAGGVLAVAAPPQLRTTCLQQGWGYES